MLILRINWCFIFLKKADLLKVLLTMIIYLSDSVWFGLPYRSLIGPEVKFIKEKVSWWLIIFLLKGKSLFYGVIKKFDRYLMCYFKIVEFFLTFLAASMMIGFKFFIENFTFHRFLSSNIFRYYWRIQNRGKNLKNLKKFEKNFFFFENSAQFLLLKWVRPLRKKISGSANVTHCQIFLPLLEFYTIWIWKKDIHFFLKIALCTLKSSCVLFTFSSAGRKY